jgi:serine/threonine protein kinase
MLLGSPVFPGQDEFDQIDVINRVLGTPSRELVNRFLSNPNEQADFEFVPCEGKSFRTILPDASDGVIELIESLLVYDANERTTAQKALELPIFERFKVRSIKTSVEFPVLESGKGEERGENELAIDTPVDSVKLQIPPLAKSASQELNRLFKTRVRAAMRIKRYSPGSPKPKVFFSTRHGRLVPVVERKKHVYA